jgi:hypothetical protein
MLCSAYKQYKVRYRRPFTLWLCARQTVSGLAVSDLPPALAAFYRLPNGVVITDVKQAAQPTLPESAEMT